MITLTDLLGNNEHSAWMSNPARPCATGNPEDWFPAERYEKSATKLCDGCPVKSQCLAYALENNEEWGIFGGLTAPQRRTIIRKRYADNTQGREAVA